MVWTILTATIMLLIIWLTALIQCLYALYAHIADVLWVEYIGNVHRHQLLFRPSSHLREHVVASYKPPAQHENNHGWDTRHKVKGEGGKLLRRQIDWGQGARGRHSHDGGSREGRGITRKRLTHTALMAG